MMRKKIYFVTLLILYGFASGHFCYAQSIKNIVKKFDIVYPKDNVISSVTEFWELARSQDKELMIYTDAVNRNVTSATKAFFEIINSKYELINYQNSLNFEHESVQEIKNDLSRYFRLNEIGRLRNIKDMKILVAKCDDINAISMPNGVIMIYGGLLFSEKFSIEEIKAVCAHEIAHFMLRHIEVEHYKFNKKLSRNKFWADLGTLGAMTANAYGQAQMEIYGGVKANYNIDVYQKLHKVLVDKAYNSSTMFRYRYSRKQELQADIIGCRYFQFLGGKIDDYLSMLEKIGVEDDKFYSKEWDHPKVQLRIDVIKYLRDNKIKTRNKRVRTYNDDPMYN